MSGQININGSDDPAYRYLMPKIQGKVEGSGNGIKTALPNVKEVAKALHRPPMHIVKYLGIELAASSRWDNKADRGMINGAFQTSVLQEKLFGYIRQFVLCLSCELPETDLVIKNEEIREKCNACGASEMVDLTHRLCAFILREHKQAQNRGATSKKDERRKRRLAAERGEVVDTPAEGATSPGAGNGKAEKKAKKEKKEKKEKKSKKDKKAKKAKKAKKEKGGDAEEDIGALDATMVGDAIAAIKAAMEGGEDLAKTVKRVGKERDLGRAARVYVAVAAVFHGVAPTVEALGSTTAEHADALASIAKKVKPLHESVLISALERHCVDSAVPGLLPILLTFFVNESALEEESIMEWHQQARPVTTHSTVTEEQHAIARESCTKLVAGFGDSSSSSGSDSDSDSSDGE